MGLNLLDFTFRVEREFKIRFPRDWHRDFWDAVKRGEDMSLEQFHGVVLALCAEQHVMPPENGIAILIREAEGTTGNSFAHLGPQALIRRDIAKSD